MYKAPSIYLQVQLLKVIQGISSYPWLFYADALISPSTRHCERERDNHNTITGFYSASYTNVCGSFCCTIPYVCTLYFFVGSASSPLFASNGGHSEALESPSSGLSPHFVLWLTSVNREVFMSLSVELSSGPWPSGQTSRLARLLLLSSFQPLQVRVMILLLIVAVDLIIESFDHQFSALLFSLFSVSFSNPYTPVAADGLCSTSAVH